jgi:hypothetical protein
MVVWQNRGDVHTTLHYFHLLGNIGFAVLVLFLIGGGCSHEADKPANRMETQDASKSPV